MVELVLQGILREFVRWWGGLPHKTQNSPPGVPHVNSVRPDRPEIHEERSVDDMKEYGDGKNRARDPVIGDPVEAEAHLREKGGKQQREHAGGHNPVKQPRGQRMSGHVLRYSRGDQWRTTASELLGFGEISHIGGVHDEEEKSQDDGNPYQEPSDMAGNVLPPRA